MSLFQFPVPLPKKDQSFISNAASEYFDMKAGMLRLVYRNSSNTISLQTQCYGKEFIHIHLYESLAATGIWGDLTS